MIAISPPFQSAGILDGKPAGIVGVVVGKEVWNQLTQYLTVKTKISLTE